VTVKDNGFLGYDAKYFGRKLLTFQRIRLPPSAELCVLTATNIIVTVSSNVTVYFGRKRPTIAKNLLLPYSMFH
jgi:hypothetical protein